MKSAGVLAKRRRPGNTRTKALNDKPGVEPLGRKRANKGGSSMKWIRVVGLVSLAWLTLTCRPVQAWHGCGGWAIGINLGPPCYYRPWGYGYYPYPVYVAPAPVVVQPAAPVVVSQAPAPVVQRAATAPAPELHPVGYNNADVDRNIQLLSDPNDRTRMDAVLNLGKLKADQAVDPVAATLAGDRSPAVRDAAARALGLIGSPKGLAALKYAAQADSDRDVRHSAQFAVEVIQSNMKH
jgi:hypothetical protein